MKVMALEQVDYHACPVCFGKIVRPCAIHEPVKDEPTVICAGCYRILMIISRMEIRGWLTPESLRNGPPNVNEKQEV